MLTIGAILFLIMLVMLATITLILYRSYRTSYNEAVKSLFLTFLFITGYAFLMSLFSIIAIDYPYILAIIYNIAVACAFFALYFITRIPTFAQAEFVKKYRKAINWTLIVVGTIVIAIQLIDLRLPIVEPTYGIIFWNANPISAWLTSTTILIYSIAWTYLTCKSISVILSKQQRLKLYVLAIDAISVGVSSFLFFPSLTKWQSLASFMVVIPGYILTILIFSYFKLKNITERKQIIAK